MKPVIEVKNLVKRYGHLHAVNGIDLTVNEGEIFGIVGPNGAGKTTTVECMEGMRKPTEGDIRVLGYHPLKEDKQMRQLIGIQLQESQLPERIKVWEAIDLFATFYNHAVSWKPLLEELGLMDKRNDYYDNLSGGQKQRLSIAMALINDPKLVFFDELTTGLDPQARRTIWDLVKRIRDKGKTVVLVTHFMEEAERLCDRVAVIDHGKVIALDSPRNLVHNLQAGLNIHFTAEEADIETEIRQLNDVIQVEVNNNDYTIHAGKIHVVADVINMLTGKDIPFYDFNIQQSNLEDVFIALTGRQIRD